MKLRTVLIFLCISITTLVILGILDLTIIDAVILLWELIIIETNKVKNIIMTIGSILAIVFTVKLRFYDTQQIRELQMTVGKGELTKAQEILSKYLKASRRE